MTTRIWMFVFYLSGVHEEIASSSSTTKTSGDFKITVTTYLPMFCKVQSPFTAYNRNWDSIYTTVTIPATVSDVKCNQLAFRISYVKFTP